MNVVRRKRQIVELDERENVYGDIEERDQTIKVYSGLYVNEASDLDDEGFTDSDVPESVVSIQ